MFDEIVRCRPWIEAALARSGGTHHFDDIVRGIYAGHFQFWPAENGCAVTEIITYPRKKVFHVFLAGGQMEQIVDMDASATEFARQNGCSAMSIAGRRGWSRVLQDNGWVETFTTLSKEL
jgi:hypothetical protein